MKSGDNGKREEWDPQTRPITSGGRRRPFSLNILGSEEDRVTTRSGVERLMSGLCEYKPGARIPESGAGSGSKDVQIQFQSGYKIRFLRQDRKSGFLKNLSSGLLSKKRLRTFSCTSGLNNLFFEPSPEHVDPGNLAREELLTSRGGAQVRTPFYLKEMLLDETIQIPHYAVGWGESCSAKLGVQSSYAVKYQSRNWRKRIGTSLADRSRVELALLPRLSLTRSRSFVLHSLAPQGRERSKAQASVANHIDKPLPASSRIDRASEARRGWMSERLKESIRTNRIDSTDMIDGMGSLSYDLVRSLPFVIFCSPWGLERGFALLTEHSHSIFHKIVRTPLSPGYDHFTPSRQLEDRFERVWVFETDLVRRGAKQLDHRGGVVTHSGIQNPRLLAFAPGFPIGNSIPTRFLGPGEPAFEIARPIGKGLHPREAHLTEGSRALNHALKISNSSIQGAIDSSTRRKGSLEFHNGYESGEKDLRIYVTETICSVSVLFSDSEDEPVDAGDPTSDKDVSDATFSQEQLFYCDFLARDKRRLYQSKADTPHAPTVAYEVRSGGRASHGV
uniref:Uncharacterized protein n=1 Tax=Salix viminalis TaxID=40686 RepID=A0A6N2KLF9_SALVM